MFRNTSAIITICALCCAGAFAQNENVDSSDEEQTKELTGAMQAAQILLSDLSDAYECEYSGYDVEPMTNDGKTAYLVTISIEDGACDELVSILNQRGAKFSLAFVAERELPEFKAADNNRIPPRDYTLIHEIDPKDNE